LQKNYATVQGLSGEVVAVSVDALNDTRQLVKDFGLPFPVLYTSGDPAAPRAYGVYELYVPLQAAPSVFIVDRAGKLRWKNVGSHYNDVPSAAEVIAQLKKL
jgi:peroxiredoxin